MEADAKVQIPAPSLKSSMYALLQGFSLRICEGAQQRYPRHRIIKKAK